MDGGEPHRDGPEAKLPVVVELTVAVQKRPAPITAVIAVFVAAIVVMLAVKPNPSTLAFIVCTAALVAGVLFLLWKIENAAAKATARTRIVIDPIELCAYVERVTVARGRQRTLQIALERETSFVLDRVHREEEPELVLRLRRGNEVLADIVKYALADAKSAEAAASKLADALKEVAPRLEERARG